MVNKVYIGVDLGATNVRSGRVASGQLIQHYSHTLPENKQRENVINAIKTAIDAVWDKTVVAIGIGVPSVVDRKTGVVYHVQNIPDWEEIALKQILEDKYGIPVFINNDANCFALGEKHFGVGKPFDHFVGLAIGTGVAGGIIQNGKLLKDVNCGSGEFGEMCYLDSKFENYCSGLFFQLQHQTNAKTIFEESRLGNQDALAISNAFAIHLGKLLKTIVCAIDPEAIVIGGSVAKGHDVFHAPMMQEFCLFPYPKSIEKLQIIYNTKSENQVLGAAYLAADADV
ncbi:MAG: ROK family protein [Flavobacteriaceae bacterium]|nr:ROK family protein [Flavobacteriaceae bacterium]